MTKTEYIAAIAANQTAISALRADLRKLRAIEKFAQALPDLKLVDASILSAAVTDKKAEVKKLRVELSKARRIVKRMAEIEDIETGKTATPKTKKSGKTDTGVTTKKSASKSASAKKSAAKPETSKAGQPAPSAEGKESPAV